MPRVRMKKDEMGVMGDSNANRGGWNEAEEQRHKEFTSEKLDGEGVLPLERQRKKNNEQNQR